MFDNKEVVQKTEISSKQLETKGLYGEVLQCLENRSNTKLKLTLLAKVFYQNKRRSPVLNLNIAKIFTGH